MATLLTRAQELTDAYLAASPLSAGALTVITDRSAVEARARDLQAKLTALGITDVTQEGKLILGGSVEITPGLRKGVAAIPNIDTSTELDLDTLPELFDYTRAGRLVSTINADGAIAVGTAAGLRPAASRSARLGAGTGAAVLRPIGSRRLNEGRTLS